MSAVPLSNTEADSTDFVAAIRAHESYVLRRPNGKRANLRFAMVPGIYLSKGRLDEIDFTGANLASADLSGANLNDASLSCANLVNANLAGATLNRADMRGAQLRGACFDHAQMESADFRKATVAFMGKDNRWSVVGQNQDLAAVSFLNCSLKGAKLNNANLKDANFNGAMLSGASFRGATLGNATFEGAVLTRVNLTDLNVPRDRLKNCIVDPAPEVRARLPQLIAILDSAQAWADSGGREGRPANIEGEDIRLLAQLMKGRKLTRINCAKAIAMDLDFSGCELQAANFDGADLRCASFVGADLRGASFRGAKLAHARFDKANLLLLALKSGAFMPTIFDGASLDRCNFEGAQRAPEAKYIKPVAELDC